MMTRPTVDPVSLLSPKRWLRAGAVAIFILAAVLALVAIGWLAAGAPGVYYTDDGSIRAPAQSASLRSILWRPAQSLPPHINTFENDEYEPRVSADGFSLLFVRGKTGANADIYFSTRSPAGWSAPAPIEAINTEADEISPALSPDGNTLYFSSNRAGGLGGYDIYRATRDVQTGAFGAAINLGDSINTRFNEYSPALSPDSGWIVFASNRPGQSAQNANEPERWAATMRESLARRDHDLYRADLIDGGSLFSKAAPIEALNTDHNDGSPSFSPVGDFLYFASDRPEGVGGFDLYRSRIFRGAVSSVEPIGAPINTSANELDPAPAMEGFGLYFATDRALAPPGSDLADIAPQQPASYNLAFTSSREVRRAIDAPVIEWASLWDNVLPWLWWALIALLSLALLAMLAWLLSRRSEERMGVMAKCVLASIMAHVILLLLLSVWQVSVGVGEALRSTGTRVAIISTPRSDGVASQVAALTTTADLAPIEAPPAERIAATLERPPAPALVQLDPTLREQETQPLVRMEQPTPIESTAPMIELDRPQAKAPEPLPQADMQTPALAQRTHTSEAKQPLPDPVRETPTPATLAPTALGLEVSPVDRVEIDPTTQLAVDATLAPLTPPTAIALNSEQLASPIEPEMRIEPVEGVVLADARTPEQSPARPEQEASTVSPQAEMNLPTLDAPASAAPAVEVAESISVAINPDQPLELMHDERLAPPPALEHESSSLLTAPDRDAVALIETPELSDPAHVAGPLTSPTRARAEEAAPKSPEPPVVNTVDRAAASAPVATTPLTSESVRIDPELPAVEITPDRFAPLVDAHLPTALPENSLAPSPDIELNLALQAPVEIDSPALDGAGAQADELASETLAPESLDARSLARAEPETAISMNDLPPVALVELAAPTALQPEAALERMAHEIVAPEVSITRETLDAPSPRVDIAIEAPPALALSRTPDLNEAPAPTSERHAAAAAPVEIDARPSRSADQLAASKAASAPERIELETPALTSNPRAAEVALAPAQQIKPSDLPPPSMPIDAPAFVSESVATPTASAPIAVDISIPHEVKIIENPYAQRAPEARIELLEQHGGSDETEQAVQRALDWLARHQSPDGRWDSDGFDDHCGQCAGATDIDSDIALTGLSLLCFLGADHTHLKNGPYQQVIQSGLDFLLRHQEANGDLRQGETMYSHGIATIALSEAYAMTSDGLLRKPVQRAIDFIVVSRNRTVGGWRYDPGQVGDTSVLGWQVLAMKSARRSGFDVPEQAMNNARIWLSRISSAARPGLCAYQPGMRPTAPMTAEALFVREVLGADRNAEEVVNAAEFISDELPSWARDANTYYWYYGTLALFQRQGEQWTRWNDRLKRELLKMQSDRGRSAGSWPVEDKWSQIGGRVYQTAICCLSLEVYYRYLPVYTLE